MNTIGPIEPTNKKDQYKPIDKNKKNKYGPIGKDKKDKQVASSSSASPLISQDYSTIGIKKIKDKPSSDTNKQLPEASVILSKKKKKKISKLSKQGPISLTLDKQGPESSDKSQRVSFDKEAEKVHQLVIPKYKPPETGTIAKAALSLIQSLSSTPFAKQLVNKFNKFNKFLVVDTQKREMLRQLKDPQYVEFYNFINQSLKPLIQEQVVNSANEFASQELVTPGFLEDLLAVVLARGFANLAGKVNEHSHEIPNFNDQPSFVNVLSYLCRTGGENISWDTIALQEKNLQGLRAEQVKLNAQMFPGISSEEEESLQLYIREYIQPDTSRSRQNEIKTILFPNVELPTDAEIEQRVNFFNHLDEIQEVSKEMKPHFVLMVRKVLLSIFPNKLADLPELQIPILSGLIQNKVFEILESVLANVLLEGHQTFAKNKTQEDIWKDKLRVTLGKPQLEMQALVDAPTTLLVESTKNFIKTDPKAVELLSNLIATMVQTEEEPSEKDQHLNQLSQNQLASWLIDSVRTLFQSNDSSLNEMGNFVSDAINHFSLILLTKGSQLATGGKKGMKSNEFIKTAMENLVEKLGTLKKGEKIPDSFWENFIKDFPLIQPMKAALIPVLKEQSAKLIEQYNPKINLEDIEQMHAEAQKEILSYEGGKALISFTEKMTDQIVEQVLEKNMSLTSSIELGESINDLFDRLVPYAVDKTEFTTWLGENIKALKTTPEGHSPKFMGLFKKGLELFLQKSIVNALKKNIHGEGHPVPQLLNRFHQAFSKAFVGLDKDEKDQMKIALTQMVKLEEMQKKLKTLKETFALKIKKIGPTYADLIEKSFETSLRRQSRLNSIAELEKKRSSILAKLNLGHDKDFWNVGKIGKIRAAMDLYKNEALGFPNYTAYLDHKIDIYNPDVSHSKEEKAEFSHRLILSTLLELPPEKTQLMKELLNTQSTLEYAQKELEIVENKLDQQEDAVKSFDYKNKVSKKLWNETASLKNEILKIREEIPLLENNLELKFKSFESLSKELADVFGLGGKEELALPSVLKDQVWPMVESIKNEQLPRMLFTNLSPMVLSFVEIEENKERLKNLTAGNPFLANLMESTLKETVGQASKLIKDYFSDGGKKPNVLTPEKITEILTSIFPDAAELYPLFAPSLQEILIGDDPSAQVYQGVLQQGIEGVLLQFFIKVAEANQFPGQDLLTVMTDKLKKLALNATPKEGVSVEETAHEMIEKVLHEILGIKDKDQLEMIPIAFRETVFKMMHEQAFQQVTPIIIPLIERNQTREKLDQVSGSEFLGHLSKAMSNDLLGLKEGLTAPEQIATSIHEKFPNLDPHFKQQIIDGLQGFFAHPEASDNVSEFISSFIEGMLLKVFLRIAQKSPAKEGKDTLLILTEKFLNIMGKEFQEATGDKDFESIAMGLNNSILKKILGIDSPESLKEIPEQLRSQAYLQIKDLLGGFILSVQKSIPVPSETDEEIKNKMKELGIAEGAIHVIAENIATLALQSVPDILTDNVDGNLIIVNTLSKNVETYIEDLAARNMQLGKLLLNYSETGSFKKLMTESITQIANKGQFVEEKKKAAQWISQALVHPMSQLVERMINFENHNKKEFNQKLLFNFLQVSVNHLKLLNQAYEVAQHENRDILFNDYLEISKGLHPGIFQTDIKYAKTIDAITQRIYSHLTPQELQNWENEKENVVNLIKSMIKEENLGLKKMDMTHFLTEFNKIHMKVANTSLTDDQIQALNTDIEGATLRYLMRQENRDYVMQREQASESFDPTIQALMELVFPNGANDLTFLPESARESVWKLLNKNLFVLIVPMIAETVFQPNLMKSMVLTTLQKINDKLAAPIEISKASKSSKPKSVSPPQELTEADQKINEVVGEMVMEMLKTMSLPDWTKKLMIDSETNSIKPEIKKMLGVTFREQFNDTFLQDNLKGALETAMAMPIGESETKKVPKAVAITEAEEVGQILSQEIKRESRNFVDGSVYYFFRRIWAEVKFRFDTLLTFLFGNNIGTKLKKGFDMVLDFIFLKIISTIFDYTLWPITNQLKEKFYNLIRLDENREKLSKIFGEVPVDQPETLMGHVVVHENLVYNIGHAINQSMDGALKQVKVVG